MEKLLGLTTVALAIKSLVEIIKRTYQDKILNIPLTLSIVIGLLVAFTINIDFLELAGFTVNNSWVGTFMTGVGFAGGSNTIFDLLNPKTEIEYEPIYVEIEEE